MDPRVARVASLANVAAYDATLTADYADGAPHVKHESLRRLYGQLAVSVFDTARQHVAVPRVLDLGAGEGSVTLPFLELGAEVTAVDISASQLESLVRRCAAHEARLRVRCEDVAETLARGGGPYDVVVFNSFLHHVPDYLAMLRDAAALLSPHGQLFSFQDPLRYDTVGGPASLFVKVAYLSWRIRKGDVVGGLLRRARRARGVYLEDSVHDNAEYHVTRNGVDHQAIERMLGDMGYRCTLVTYFSTQSPVFQRLGAALGVRNTFGMVAYRQ